MNPESEFGKGLIYPLALFLCHAESQRFDIKAKEEDGLNDQLWFNAASDHLYDLEIPEQLINTELGERIINFRKEVINYGHGEYLLKPVPKGKKEEMIQEAKDIMFELDVLFENYPVKAEYE